MNQGTTSSAAAKTTAEMSVGPEPSPQPDYCQIQRRVDDTNGIMETPANGALAVNRRSCTDRPVHKNTARHPCYPAPNRPPIYRRESGDPVEQQLPKISCQGGDDSGHQYFDCYSQRSVWVVAKPSRYGNSATRSFQHYCCIAVNTSSYRIRGRAEMGREVDAKRAWALYPLPRIGSEPLPLAIFSGKETGSEPDDGGAFATLANGPHGIGLPTAQIWDKRVSSWHPVATIMTMG
jgi:hypothetical protein